MPYQLILSTDTLDQGRIKINDFFQTSSLGIFTSSTGSYSIISTNNKNSASGNRSFVHGYSNSANTNNYQTILNGTGNLANGSFAFIGNGFDNNITTSNSLYSTILNGRQNNIGSNYATTRSTIIQGFNNNIPRANFATISNGSGNYLTANYSSIINGKNNKISNIASSSSRPFFNTVINGYNNLISGGSVTLSYNMIANGFDNIINSYGTGSINYNFIQGKRNKILRPGGAGSVSRNNFMFGNYITNQSTVSTNLSHCFIFGKGSSLASPLKATQNYEVIFSNNSTKKVRIFFGNTPNAYLSSGSWQNSGADYGEYFEWKDKNINNISRAGFFVEIEDGCVKIASSQNVIGVVSKATAFIGDSLQDYWSEMYLKDDWGQKITQKFQVYEIKNQDGSVQKEFYVDKNGIIFEELPNENNINGSISTTTKKEDGEIIGEREVDIFNPNYNPNFKYIPRKDRPEWDVIGLLGKLRVRTSEQITGNYVDVDINTGMAKNGTKYPVMKKIKDFDGNYGIVLIFFK